MNEIEYLKTVHLHLTGTSPLLMHNIRLANPMNEFAKLCRTITDKRKKTDADWGQLAHYEWQGGIYFDPELGPYLNAEAIVRSISRTAKVKRLGETVKRSVYIVQERVPIRYNGPRDLEKLWADKQYQDLRAVGVKAARTMRCRPCFPQWEVELDLMVVVETLNLDEFISLVHLAGQIEGVGDGRSIGKGRFTAKVTVADEKKSSAPKSEE